MDTPLVVLSAIAALALGPLPEDRLQFAVDEGSSFEKHFALVFEVEVTDSNFTFGDQEVPLNTAGATTRIEREVHFSDTYGALDGGRPLELEREIRGATMRSEETFGGEPAGEEERESELVDQGVVFRWDAEEEEYTAQPAEGSRADEDQLRDLWEDADLRLLLPEGPVLEGDSWSPGAEAFFRTILAGGDMGLGSESADEDLPEVDGSVMLVIPELPKDPFVWLDSFDGDCEAHFRGVQEERGVELGRIELEYEVLTRVDLADWLQDHTPGRPDMEFGEAVLSIEGQGELLWDLEGGHLASIELGGDVEIVFEAGWQGPGGDSPPCEYGLVLEGGLEFSGGQGAPGSRR